MFTRIRSFKKEEYDINDAIDAEEQNDLDDDVVYPKKEEEEVETKTGANDDGDEDKSDSDNDESNMEEEEEIDNDFDISDIESETVKEEPVDQETATNSRESQVCLIHPDFFILTSLFQRVTDYCPAFFVSYHTDSESDPKYMKLVINVS